MPDLVTVAEQKTFLKVLGSGDDTLLTDLLDHVEALLERACDRVDIPFKALENGRVEVKDGTGLGRLYLDYPLGTMTSILLGRDTSDPVETVDTTNLDVVVFVAGKRKVERVDGKLFGATGAPRYVHVTYDTQADLPEDAKLALKRGVAHLYRQRGSEGAKSVKLLDASATLLELEDLPEWKAAIARHRRFRHM